MVRRHRLASQQGAGVLEVFYDDFPRAKSRRLSFCYRASTLDRVTQFAKAHTRAFGKATSLSDHDLDEGDIIRLRKPLPKRQYRRPILELYDIPDTQWRFFYSVYLPDVIRMGNPSKASLVNEAAEFFVDVARTVLGTEVPKYEPYANVKNRALVRRHLVRERSAKLADAAKIRDGFNCKVCQTNFGNTYGELGSGFAEAHHVIPLSSPKAKGTTSLDDLITVCSNCHRMLHRMAGEVGDAAKLRQLVAKRSPSKARVRA